MTDVASPDVNQPQDHVPGDSLDEPPASLQVAHDVAAAAAGREPPAGAALRAEVQGEEGANGQLQPGWYVDPADDTQQRYWDGDGYVGEPIPVTQDAPEEPLPGGALAVPVGDPTRGRANMVYVIRRDDWPSSALAALRSGDYESWAEQCLARDADFKVWLDLDPTVGEIEAMFTKYAELAGTTPGKSRTSRRSLMRARRN